MDLMDLALLDRLETVHWNETTEVADLGCGSGDGRNGAGWPPRASPPSMASTSPQRCWTEHGNWVCTGVSRRPTSGQRRSRLLLTTSRCAHWSTNICRSCLRAVRARRAGCCSRPVEPSSLSAITRTSSCRRGCQTYTSTVPTVSPLRSRRTYTCPAPMSTPPRGRPRRVGNVRDRHRWRSDRAQAKVGPLWAGPSASSGSAYRTLTSRRRAQPAFGATARARRAPRSGTSFGARALEADRRIGAPSSAHASGRARGSHDASTGSTSDASTAGNSRRSALFAQSGPMTQNSFPAGSRSTRVVQSPASVWDSTEAPASCISSTRGCACSTKRSR